MCFGLRISYFFFLLNLKKCEQSKDSLMKSLKCMNREYKNKIKKLKKKKSNLSLQAWFEVNLPKFN